MRFKPDPILAKIVAMNEAQIKHGGRSMLKIAPLVLRYYEPQIKIWLADGLTIRMMIRLLRAEEIPAFISDNTIYRYIRKMQH